jgi:DNA-binding transcriptional ArsR family regulator
MDLTGGDGFGRQGRRPPSLKEDRMPPFGSDRNRIETDRRHALRHPTRIKILEVTAHERGRPLSVDELTAALVKTPGFEHTTHGEVNYHRARLLDAELLPLPE